MPKLRLNSPVGKLVRITTAKKFQDDIGECVGEGVMSGGVYYILVTSENPEFQGKTLKFFSGEYEVI